MKNYRIALALSLIFALFVPSVQADDEIVWFIHGVVTTRDEFTEEIDVLKEIYPNAEEVTLKKWNSPKMGVNTPGQIRQAWTDAVKNSEAYASELAKEIETLSSSQRKRLILIGHSLGGRIVVRASSILAKDKVHVKKIILAGSAINNDDPDIPATWAVSKEIVENIVNPKDFLLGVYHGIGEGHAALGTGYLGETDGKPFREILMSNTMVHYGYVYFRLYRNVLKNNNYLNEEIIVPQVYINANFPTTNAGVWWNQNTPCHDWKLQQNNVTGHYRILDPDDVRHAWGGEAKMAVSFNRVCEQLNQKMNASTLPSKWWNKISPIKVNINMKLKVTDGDVWWDTLDCYKGWKIEKHKSTGHCRIIDPDNYRRVWGGESKTRQSFEDIKKQIDDVFNSLLTD